MKHTANINILSLVAFLLFCVTSVAQVSSPSASKEVNVGGDILYLFKSWDDAIVTAQSDVQSHFDWYELDEQTLVFTNLIKSVDGVSDSLIPTKMSGFLCRITNGDKVSEYRFWVNVPLVESIQMSIDSVFCDGMEVTGIAKAEPSKVYDWSVHAWTDVPQNIVYNWYVADTLQTTTNLIQPTLESPMEHSAIKVVALNDVKNQAEMVDTVESFGVKALYKHTPREREVPNEISSGESYSAPAEIEFTNESKGNVTATEWVMGNVSRLYDKNPVYSFQLTGKHRVSLIVTDEESGCSSVDSTLQLTITDAFMEFPNVFTPNGDGVNDEFRTAYKSLKSYKITIYNRWGREVYQSTDPASGWNGKEGNANAAEGVYMYVAEGEGFDKGIKIKRHGSVTLVR